MKRKHWYIVIIAMLFVFLFPFLIRILIWISESTLLILNIAPLLIITNIGKVDFSDYVSITIALISCTCSGAIGYFTYKLSLSIRNYDLQREAQYETNLRAKIVSEIEANCKIIQQCEKKVANDYAKITLSEWEFIYEIRPTLSKEEFTQLKELYSMFLEYKSSGCLLPNNKTRWITKDGSVIINTIITSLMREAIKL